MNKVQIKYQNDVLKETFKSRALKVRDYYKEQVHQNKDNCGNHKNHSSIIKSNKKS